MHHLKKLSGVLLAALALPLSVYAAEWSAEPRISLRTGHNDNIRLTTLDHSSVWETALSPAVRFGVATENQGVFGDAGFAIRRFSGGDGRESSSLLDREDYHLKSNAYHGTERNIYRGQINYTRDSTLDSELDETGNVIDDRATRDRLTLGPSWESILSEKMKLNVDYQFTTVAYSDDPGISNLIEYDYHSLSGSLVREINPRTKGTLSSSYTLYKPESDFNSGTISLQAGISRNFSETLLASFLAGQRRTTSDTLIATGICLGPGTYPACTGGGIPLTTGSGKDDVDSTGLVFAASIAKTLESGSLSATLSRTSSPAGDGELLDTTRLLISGEHRFTKKLRSSVGIDISEREAIVNRFGQETNLDSETLIRIKPRITYRWNRIWELSGEYEYAKNDNALSSTATRNAVYLTLGYNPAKVSISR